MNVADSISTISQGSRAFQVAKTPVRRYGLSEGSIAAIFSKSSVVSSSMTSIASSTVTIPTSRFSRSTMGMARKSYLLSAWATSSLSSVVLAHTTSGSMISSIRSSSSASSRSRTDSTPSRCRVGSVTYRMLMVSSSPPIRRMRLKASSTVMSFFRDRNSMFIMEPALSSGYFSISLMDLRISGVALSRIRMTTLAGISSTISTASSRYSSSSTSVSSVLEKPLISISWLSGSSSTNTSAAVSLGSRRYSRGICSCLPSSSSRAISAGSMGRNRSRSSA